LATRPRLAAWLPESRSGSRSDDQRTWPLDPLFDTLEKLGGWRVIDGALAKAQAEGHLVPGHACVIVHHDRLSDDAAHAQDRRVAQIDEGCEAIDVEQVEVVMVKLPHSHRP